jgi:autotransporter-associated beta strand protein
MKKSPTFFKTPGLFSKLAVSGAILFGLNSSYASTLYWGGWDGVVTSNTFLTSGNWFTDTNETTASGAVPGSADDLVFNTVPDSARGGTITLSSTTSIASLTFGTTANTTIMANNSTAKNLNVGAGGLTVNSGSGAVTLGNSSQGIRMRFSASQTWSNNSTNNVAIANSAGVMDNSSGDVTLTLNAASSGNFSNNGAYSDSLTGQKLAIVVDSVGTGVVSFGNSAYTGGTTIKRGILSANGVGIGTEAVKLGHTQGSANATLRINTTSSVTTGLDVQAGNTGVNTLEFSAASGLYGANITLNNDLNVAIRSSGGSSATITGIISGTGDLIKGQYQGGNSQILILSGANTYTGDTHITNGAFTLAAGGGLTFSIGANGVSNQVTGTSTGAVIFAGTFSFDLSGASLVDGSSWTIVNKTALTGTSFAGTFAVADFNKSGGIWTNGNGFSFSESSGILSYSAVPEPSTYALFGGAGALLLACARRRSIRSA